jgi:hypothetical protein
MPLCSPPLPLLLGHPRTIAQEVGTTDAVRTAIGIITRPPVMHAPPGKTRPDADLVHGSCAARGMPRQMRQETGAVHVQPMQHAIHANASLIGMLESAGHDQLGNALDRRCQPLCGQFTPLDQGTLRDVAATEGRERLAGACRGEQLSLLQIDRQRLQVGTILDWCADRSGKAAQAGTVTGGAPDGFDLMLLAHEADLRHVQDLTVFDDPAWDTAEILMALAAHLGTVMHHCIWLFHQTERVPGMPSLTSRRLAAGTTCTAGQPPQPIRRGRLTARATVLGQAVFQVLDPGMRLCQLLFQRQQLSYQPFEDSVFFPQGVQFFIFGHSCTLAGSLSFGKSSRSRPE